jgi:hypothetical protein
MRGCCPCGRTVHLGPSAKGDQGDRTIRRGRTPAATKEDHQGLQGTHCADLNAAIRATTTCRLARATIGHLSHSGQKEHSQSDQALWSGPLEQSAKLL